MSDDQIGHIRDDDGCDVMTLGRMYNTKDAAVYLHEKFGIPDVTPRRLTASYRRGEITASVFGRLVMYAERDLAAWVASRYGNAHERYAAVSEAQRGNQHAKRGKKTQGAKR